MALLAAIVGSFANSPSAAAATYTGDFTTTFANPERGYHNRYEIINDPAVNDYASSATSIAGFNPDMLDRTFARAKANGNTLIHSYLHLDKYKTTALPQALLDNLNSGLAAIRAAGLKIVLRAAYAWSESPQVVEGLMIRPYRADQRRAHGQRRCGQPPGDRLPGAVGRMAHQPVAPHPFNRARRRCALPDHQEDPRHHARLDPAGHPLPDLYQGSAAALGHGGAGSSSALTQVEKDRIGFHNDCFLSDSADMGTYDNNSWMGWFYIEEKKQWMYDRATSFGSNTIMGGETCDQRAQRRVRRECAGRDEQAELQRDQRGLRRRQHQSLEG